MDIFDEVAAGGRKGGDIFDQVAAPKKPSLVSQITRPIKAQAYEAAAALNEGVGSFAQSLESAAQYLDKKTGINAIDPNDIGKAPHFYADNAQYWRDKAAAVGENGIDKFVGNAIGGGVPGMADFMLGVPLAAVKGAAQANNGGKSELAGAVESAADRALMGGVLKATAPLKMLSRAAVQGGTFAADAAAKGKSLDEVGQAAGTGAMYAFMGGPGQVGMREAAAKIKAALPQHAETVDAAVNTIENPASTPDQKTEAANLLNVLHQIGAKKWDEAEQQAGLTADQPHAESRGDINGTRLKDKLGEQQDKQTAPAETVTPDSALKIIGQQAEPAQLPELIQQPDDSPNWRGTPGFNRSAEQVLDKNIEGRQPERTGSIVDDLINGERDPQTQAKMMAVARATEAEIKHGGIDPEGYNLASGKPAPKGDIFDQLIPEQIDATSEQVEAKRPALNAESAEVPSPPKAMTFDEYSESQGVSRTAPSFPESHRAPGGVSKSTDNAQAKRISDAMAEWQDQRDQLRQRYSEGLASGEVVEPTRMERIERTAQGNGEAAEAAKRILDKRKQFLSDNDQTQSAALVTGSFPETAPDLITADQPVQSARAEADRAALDGSPESTFPTGKQSLQVAAAGRDTFVKTGPVVERAEERTHQMAKNQGVIEQVAYDLQNGQPAKRFAIEERGQGSTLNWLAEPSTYPDYFRNKGYTKKAALGIIEKHQSGKALTEKQANILDDLILGKRSETASELQQYRKLERAQKEAERAIREDYPGCSDEESTRRIGESRTRSRDLGIQAGVQRASTEAERASEVSAGRAAQVKRDIPDPWDCTPAELERYYPATGSGSNDIDVDKWEDSRGSITPKSQPEAVTKPESPELIKEPAPTLNNQPHQAEQARPDASPSQEGDRVSESISDAESEHVYNTARKVLGPEKEELASKVWEHVLRNFDRSRGVPLEAFTRETARWFKLGNREKKSVNAISMEERRGEDQTLGDILESSGPNENDLASMLSGDQAARLLDKLPERQADILRQIFWEDKHLTEIATEQGVTRQAIEQQRDAGLAKLRELAKDPEPQAEKMRAVKNENGEYEIKRGSTLYSGFAALDPVIDHMTGNVKESVDLLKSIDRETSREKLAGLRHTLSDSVPDTIHRVASLISDYSGMKVFRESPAGQMALETVNNIETTAKAQVGKLGAMFDDANGALGHSVNIGGIKLRSLAKSASERLWVKHQFKQAYEAGEKMPTKNIQAFADAWTKIQNVVGKRSEDLGVLVSDPRARESYRVDKIAAALGVDPKEISTDDRIVKGEIVKGGNLSKKKLAEHFGVKAADLSSPQRIVEFINEQAGHGAVKRSDIYIPAGKRLFKRSMGDSYFPRMLTDEAKRAFDLGRGELYEALLKAGANDRHAEDSGLDLFRDNNWMAAEQARRAAPLESARIGYIPDKVTLPSGRVVKVLEDDPFVVIPHYIHSTAQRQAVIEHMGQEDAAQYAAEIHSALKAEGHDTEADIWTDLWSIMNGTYTKGEQEFKSRHGFITGAVSGAESIARTAMLSASTLSQISGWVPIATRAGALETVRQMTRLASESATRRAGAESKTSAELEFARNLGGFAHDVLGHTFETEDLSGMIGRAGDKVLKATGFELANRKLNQLASLAALRNFADSIEYLRNPKDNILRAAWGKDAEGIRRSLQDNYDFTADQIDRMVKNGMDYHDFMNIDAKAQADPKFRQAYDDMAQAVQKFVGKTNLYNESIMNRPAWMSKRVARMVMAFSSYQRAMGRARNIALREVTKGNVRPIVSLLVGGAIGGAAQEELKRLLFKKDREPIRDNMDAFIYLVGCEVDAATFGLLGGYAQDAMWDYRKGDIGVSVPMWDWWGRNVLGIAKSIDEGDPMPAYKTLAKSTPIVRAIDAQTDGPLSEDNGGRHRHHRMLHARASR